LPFHVASCVHSPVLTGRLFFFSARSAAHRELHSFPTRRSSDLSAAPIRAPDRVPRPPSTTAVSRVRLRVRVKPLGAASRTEVARSEEHTSELQSRENLVCRLLLEKKKTTPHGCET